MLRGRAGYEVIDNQRVKEAHRAELLMTILYPVSPTLIVVLLKTPGPCFSKVPRTLRARKAIR